MYLVVEWWDAPSQMDSPPDGDVLEFTLMNSAGFVYGHSDDFSVTIDSISTVPDVFTIGAAQANGTIAWYSSGGPTNAGVMKPDFVARTDITTFTSQQAGDPPFNGTSAASPAAAGLAALVLDAGLADTHTQLRQWLIANAAVDRGPVGPDNTYGYGELILPAPPAPDPQPQPNPNPNPNPQPPQPDPALVGTSVFVPHTPWRVFDSRPDQAAAGPKGKVPDGGTVEVPITGGQVPADATAVVMNVTVTEPDGPGFVAVYPSGGERPITSSVNITTAGQTRAALVTVPIGADGRVTFFSRGGAHIVADVAGVFVPNADQQPVSGGRFVSVTPSRLFDTRNDDSALGFSGPLPAGASLDVPVLGRAGVPDAGVSAVVLNLTATESASAGYLTLHPTGTPRPTASNVNMNGPGATAPNLAVVPLGDDGRITVFASHGSHAIGDVVGYVTSDQADADSLGLFVPLTPARVFDTRPGETAPGEKGYIAPEHAVTTTIAGLAGVPGDASAVVLSVAGVDSGAGYLTVWNTGVARPVASTINFENPPDTRANGVWQRLGEAGSVSFFSKGGGHVIADVAGYFLP